MPLGQHLRLIRRLLLHHHHHLSNHRHRHVLTRRHHHWLRLDLHRGLSLPLHEMQMRALKARAWPRTSSTSPAKIVILWVRRSRSRRRLRSACSRVGRWRPRRRRTLPGAPLPLRGSRQRWPAATRPAWTCWCSSSPVSSCTSIQPSDEPRCASAALSSDLGAAATGAGGGCSVRYIFVVGGGAGEARLVRRDVLSLPVADGYRQIVHKVLGALRWANGALRFKYLLKTDDDSFVCAARLLELLRPLPRLGLYLGVVNPKHSVVTGGQGKPQYERWRDDDYVALFNRTVYAPYMQGAGYVLSSDLSQAAVAKAEGLPRLTAVEDALLGTLLEQQATSRLSRPAAFRHKNRDDYAATVCAHDTEFVLLHKLTGEELSRCRAAMEHRRSRRCPKGPCRCRSLGHTFKRPRKLIKSFEQATQLATLARVAAGS